MNTSQDNNKAMSETLVFDGAYRGARKGTDFLQHLENYPPELWYQGKRIENICHFSPLKNGVKTLAALYDYQWDHSELMLESIEGRKVSRSYSITKDRSDLIAVGKALLIGAQFSQGMLGRDPAYLNRSITSFAGSADFFDIGGRVFSNNVRDYFRFARDNDLALTHTIVNPRINRHAGPAFQKDPTISTHVTKETDAGIYVTGARLVATLPFADEIAVLPARLLDVSNASKDYAFAFVLPTNTAGLKFICRDSVDYGMGSRNHPLGGRYEEMDAVAIFDNVFVPWERVFCYRDIDICNRFYEATGATAHITYQVVCKNIVKIEFFLGLISLMIHGSGLERFQHIHQKMADVWVGWQTMKAFKSAAEVGSRLNDFGMLVPDWSPLEAARFMFPSMYPRIVEIVQQIGASGLVTLPTSEDLDGPLRTEIDKYFQSARLEAADKIDLYRLAWDASVSAFAGRQVLYERFFFGDPVSMATRIFRNNPCSDLMERVNHFIK
ncbi:4-hydroxyphenylacetate 3-monooxygenase [Pseudomonas chlororaphis]|uniref:4-hydroxyphenylacetate 3-monooxygenase n=1 Tax=Pseudomonas chlororaphis TaxID=587753 RepID=A0A3G7TUY0_9PSED|nr:4-hydroxyphenylacetate 3-monooxygenase, oxygenase component [Pseudomonas chlororaphis]AZE50119.1 4-hydroxyphenylacetate 3-monooxygenase [Pseudomonas chlororaphis]